MDMIKRISGIVFVVVAVAVAVHAVVEPLYHVSAEAGVYSQRIWFILDLFMLLTVVLGVVFGYIRKRDSSSEEGSRTITREFLAANTLFYGFLFVGILFCWNFFNFLTFLRHEFIAVGADTISLVWILIDATLPLLAGTMGISLLREDRTDRSAAP